MFTGIIQAVGKVQALTRTGDDARLTVDAPELDLSDAAIGDSIAVNGVCLTAVAFHDAGFSADVSGETLACTTLGDLAPGAPVNLEPALAVGARLGGHFVSGHVDGVGKVVERCGAGQSVRFRIQAPDALARYIAHKGSICVDGVSLTVNAVDGAVFDLNIVPHTLQATTMSGFAPGRRVNLEVDIIARYLERLLLGDDAARAEGGLSAEFLAEHGFMPSKTTAE
jgi:riboflavin synthase